MHRRCFVAALFRDGGLQRDSYIPESVVQVRIRAMHCLCAQERRPDLREVGQVVRLYDPVGEIALR